MMNQKIMNQKNTMNILALKLIRDFFNNPFTKPYAIILARCSTTK